MTETEFIDSGWTTTLTQHSDGNWSVAVRREGSEPMSGYTIYAGNSEELARQKAREFVMEKRANARLEA